MSRIKVYNSKTGKLNLASPRHVKVLIEKLLSAHLFEGVYIKDANAVIGLLKIVLSCMEMENQAALERAVCELEQQLETSKS